MLLLVPTLLPFNFHWNVGLLPPFAGIAVKITLLPAQTGFEDAAMLRLTGRLGITVIITWFEVAGFPVPQGALDVRTQVTASLFARVVVV